MTVACQLRMPDQSHFFRHIGANADHAERVVTAGSRVGRSVVICGAGPSLADEHARLPASHELWACNSALPYLMDRGVRVTHGFAIDQHEAMLGDDEWARTFDVEYLIASSVHPSLVAHLLEQNRSLTFFHNYLGIPNPDGWTPPQGVIDRQPVNARGQPEVLSYEMWLYRTHYRESVRVGHGINAVPRAVCLALIMGFDSITVVGADCACRPDGPPMPPVDTPDYHDWMRGLVMYADGRTAATYGADATMAEATFDGVRWHTRPDMIVSAMHLVEIDRSFPGRLHFVGQTLPNVFRTKDDAFWADLPSLSPDGRVLNFAYDHPAIPELAEVV